MKAREFHESFERAFVAASRGVDLRRVGGGTPKWKAPAPGGSVTFAFATNPKAAGLLPLLWPGEFRPTIRWRHGGSDAKAQDDVSFFQYATRSGIEAAVSLQRAAIGKYLRNRFEDAAQRERWIAAYDPFAAPRPNHEQWFYYFDADDAAAWGDYFGGAMGAWMGAFGEHPESLDAWCRRVLWKKGGTDDADQEKR